MKLIFLYGPPAAGKYSIAKVIAEKTGYKLFHNHATVDLVKSVFEFGTKPFWTLVRKIRLDFFEQTAKQNISGLIFTFVYEKDLDDSLVREIIDKVTSNGEEVVFIQIYCEKEELIKRVKEESRKQFQKIKTEKDLLQLLDNKDLFSKIDFVKSTKIDNTKLSVEEAVQKVLEILE